MCQAISGRDNDKMRLISVRMTLLYICSFVLIQKNQKIKAVSIRALTLISAP
jgi:hypothetical protein